MTHRDRAVAWAVKVASDPGVIVLDLETTGLGPDAEIVDVAVVRMDGKVVLNDLICPLRSIPLEASRVHGITERMVHKAPLFREYYPRFSSAIRGKTLCIFNGAYDTKIIRQVCAAEGLPDPIGAWQCAMLAAADFIGEPNKRGDGFRWPKLGEACDAMGVRLTGAHRAMADAQATRLLVLTMAAHATPTAEATPVQLALLGRG